MHNFGAFLEFSKQLALVAAESIRPHFRSLSSVEHKSDDSPVTIADKAAEQAMRDMIAEHYPSHGIIGEEYDNQQSDADYVWVLDPIDGTRNFITGQPLFTTLVALTYKGTPLTGAIYQPISNELWTGFLGGQTSQFAKPSFSRADTTLADARLSSTSPYLFDDRQRASFDALRAACAIDVYGSDAYAYAMLASGNVDIVCEAGLNAYDIMALIPIIEGAGGVITDWAGNPLRLQNMSNIDVIASANHALHDEVLELL